MRVSICEVFLIYEIATASRQRLRGRDQSRGRLALLCAYDYYRRA